MCAGVIILDSSRGSSAGPQYLLVLGAGQLQVGKFRVISVHDQVTDLLERIEHGDALAPANRRGGLFQQLVRGLQLTAQPVGDPCMRW